MLFWNNDYSPGLAYHMRPVRSAVRPASAECCGLCLSYDGLVESWLLNTERHRSQKIHRSSDENISKWELFRIAIYRSSGYNPEFCPAISEELPGVLMFWNPVQGSVSRMRADPDVLGIVNTGAVIHRKYPSSDVNTIDCNIEYRSKCSSMIYGKTNVHSIAMKADRSSVMVSLKTLQTTVSLNIHKTAQINW